MAEAKNKPAKGESQNEKPLSRLVIELESDDPKEKERATELGSLLLELGDWDEMLVEEKEDEE